MKYMERSLAEEYEQHRVAYAAGLASLAGFAELPAERQDAILGVMERQADPFFELVRRHAVEGMFCDPSWVGMPAGSAGSCSAIPGPGGVWTASDQELDAEPRAEGQR